jgi:hypothetical protein
MTDPKTMSDSVIVLDGEILRSDCDGRPRFYLCRIYPEDLRNGYPQVKVRLELEGNPTAYAHEYCRDHPDDIREAAEDCVSQIEDLCQDQWDREAASADIEARRSEERFYYR